MFLRPHGSLEARGSIAQTASVVIIGVRACGLTLSAVPLLGLRPCGLTVTELMEPISIQCRSVVTTGTVPTGYV